MENLLTETRFSWQGNLGNWFYERLRGNVGRIVQTYYIYLNDPEIDHDDLQWVVDLLARAWVCWGPNSVFYDYAPYNMKAQIK